MPNLLPVATVRQRLGFDNLTVVNDAIQLAIDAASVHLEGALRTSFLHSAVSDTFWVGNLDSAWNGSFHEKFKLTRGFLSTTASVDIRYASSLKRLSTAGNYTLVSLTENTILDYEKGVVDVLDIDLRKQYVRISYEAGFDPDTADSTIYNQSQIPDWLEQAALFRTMLDLQSVPTLRNEEASQLDNVQLSQTLSDMLARHIRYSPAAKKPVNTEGLLYTLSTLTLADGERLTGSGTAWSSAYLPVSVPIVHWKGQVFEKVDSNPGFNQYTLTGTTFTFGLDLGTDAPIVWYRYGA